MGGALGIYYGQFVIDADSQDLGVGASNIALTAGSYYLRGYDAEGTEQFTNHLQTKIRALTGQANSIVDYSSATDRLTVTLNTAANLVFWDAALANICGFSNGTIQPSASLHTASGHPRYVWRPSRAVADTPTDTATVWQPRSSTVSSRSVDGTAYTVPGGTTYEATVRYTCLPRADVIAPASGTVYLDFCQWFQDVPAAGRPFRYVSNRQQYAASSDYVTAIWGEDGQSEVGLFGERASRRIASYQGLWDVSVPMLKKV